MSFQHREFGPCNCPNCAGVNTNNEADPSAEERSPQMAPVYDDSQVIGQIDSGQQWSGSQISYGFLQSSPSWDIGYEGDGFSAFNSNQMAAAREIMSLWDDLIAPSFTEHTSNQEYANVTFGNTTSSINYAHAYYPGNYAWAGETWYNAQTYTGLYSPDAGDYYYMTIIHEVGHAIGLSHPGSYNGGSPTYANDAVYAQDTHQWSVMSYFSASNTGADWNGGSGWQYAQTPMVHDILTIQAIYGADTTTRTGDTTYGFNSNAGQAVFDFSQNSSPVLSIYDAGGTDTLDLSGFSQRAIIDLTPGTYSSAGGTSSSMTYNIGIAVNSWIENAIGGSGDDTITGNSLDNTLDGSSGSDALIGGLGSDTYIVDNAGDTVTENADEGTDTVRSTITYTLGDNIENLTLTGSANLNGIGNSLANTITGNAGNNMLDGRGGADTMHGGAGDDVYFFDQAGDTASENANEGFDTVYAGFSVAVGANIEAFVFTGSADLSVAGSSVGNFLYGNSGNNYIDGGGGLDNMYGGTGDDIYIFSDLGDAAFENAGEGFDTVFASIGMGLSASSSIEALVLTGTDDLSAFGNNVANFIYGNAGNNYLDGGGDIDNMYGGLGDDIYVFSELGDAAFENAGEGFDTVFSSISTGLSASSSIEALVLTGTADNSAFGNNLNNFVYGNSGNNYLDGGGGVDAMFGNDGNDIYAVHEVGDQAIENANEGFDTVFSDISFALAANVEALALNGAADIDATGNTLNNNLYGNAGANRIDGGGGADTLTGNGDLDTFIFDAGEMDGDTITDFDGNGAGAGDMLEFHGFGAGASLVQLNATQWQITYNGGASQETITFSNAAGIDASDFMFV